MTINHYFQNLTDYVHILPEQAQQLYEDKIKWRSWLNGLEKQKFVFCNAALDDISRVADPSESTKLVQYLFFQVNDVLNRVISYDQEGDIPPHLTFIFERIGFEITDLLNIYTHRFRSYFHASSPLPYAYSLMAGRQLGVSLKRIKREIEILPVNPILLAIAIKPIAQRVEDPAGITYRELDYLNSLCENILMIKSDSLDNYLLLDYQQIVGQLEEAGLVETRMTIVLNILLLHFNFNSPDYIGFCTNALQRKLSTLPSEEEKFNVLRLYQKLMNQIILKPHFSLNPDSEIIAKKAIRKWIDDELVFFPPPRLLAGSHQPAPIEKIDTSLSTWELAIVIDVFIEARIITDTNMAKVCRSFAKTFNTVGTDQLSPESLRSKAINKKASSVEAVRKALVSCINVMRAWQ